jgi:dienelactone hydrolase
VRRVVHGFVFAVFFLAALFIVLGIWLSERDPVTSLPQPEYNLAASTFVQPTNDRDTERRTVQHIILHSQKLGDIGFTVSLPNPLPSESLPVIVVLGGLGTGENNIRYVTEAGPNAVVGYDWPMPVQFYSGFGIAAQMPELYGHIMSIPAQVASSLDWLKQQPWADRQRISLLGFSLGALAAPATQDISQRDGTPIHSTILAYGGAPFGSLMAVNPHIKPYWLRRPLAFAIDRLLAPLQASNHLAQLTGHFLVIEGQNDSLIPAQARANLRDAVPQPKKIVTLAGDHMGVGADRLQLLSRIIAISRAWLNDDKAVNDR